MHNPASYASLPNMVITEVREVGDCDLEVPGHSGAGIPLWLRRARLRERGPGRRGVRLTTLPKAAPAPRSCSA